MRTIPIGKVAKVRNGYAFSSSDFHDEGIPVIRMSDLKELEVDINGAVRVPLEFLDEYADYRIYRGDLIIGMSGSIGKTAVYTSDQPALQNQRVGVFQILDDKKLNSDFLRFFAFTLEDRLLELGKGVAVKNISSKEIEAIDIPLPSLDQQRRIADILGRADRLRRLCRYALELGESYLQAVFLETFGDPVTNPMGWEIRPLGEVIEAFEGGTNFPPIADGELASEWRVLKVSAATWGFFDPVESKPISPDVEFEDALIVRKGDLIFSRANTTELVGAACLVREHPPKVLLPDKLWRIKLKPHSPVLPEYVLYSLRQPFIRHRIGVLATGTSGSMKNISKSKTATLPILLPPTDYQGQFAGIVRQFNHIRDQQREQLRQAEHLFASLLDRAFRGEV